MQTFLDIIDKLMGGVTLRQQLEQYIVSNDPKNIKDLEALERDFFNRRTSSLY